MKENKFTLDTPTGKLEYEILDQVYVKQYQKNYLIYTDNSTDENGELNIFVSICKSENDQVNLFDIEEESELNTVANIIEKMWSK